MTNQNMPDKYIVSDELLDRIDSTGIFDRTKVHLANLTFDQKRFLYYYEKAQLEIPETEILLKSLCPDAKESDKLFSYFKVFLVFDNGTKYQIQVKDNKGSLKIHAPIAKEVVTSGAMEKLGFRLDMHSTKGIKTPKAYTKINILYEDLIPFLQHVIADLTSIANSKLRIGNIHKKVQIQNYGIHDFIEKLLSEYVPEKEHDFANNALGEYVRKTVPEVLVKLGCFNADQYIITGSVGEKNWAEMPWIAILNKAVTDSVRRGVYAVYLMNRAGDKMYLAFNQGFSEIFKQYGHEKCSRYLLETANTLIDKIESRGFLHGPNIDLTNDGDVIEEFYCKGTIFYKEYKKDSIPDDMELLEDLQKMRDIYEDYVELTTKYDPVDAADVDENVEKQSHAVYEKNMILYGPPGTGKTYYTAIYAVAICDNKSISELTNYDAVLKRYHELKNEGRIAFTTFHQSYGYEEFVEGISPVISEHNSDEASGKIGYTYKDGVFKKFCNDARKLHICSSELQISDNVRIWNVNLGGKSNPELKAKCFAEGSIRIGWDKFPEIITEETEGLGEKEKPILLNFQDEMEIGDIVLSFHSKTSIDGIGIVTGVPVYDTAINDGFPRKRTVKWVDHNVRDIVNVNGGVQLDRKSVYPLWRINVNSILSMLENSDFDLEVEDETKPYVFIIDEINRGNISKIFGELITLIENTKREGMKEEASAILPYSNAEFSVPNNVYILGTMNTADRSIALLDTALRRRFQFIEMMPDSNVLRKIGADRIEENGMILDVAAMLDTINNRIEYLFDREHMIGHAFFTCIKADPTVAKLASIFKKSVLPLLQEYFYEDYSKIMLVLGDNGKDNNDFKFILNTETKPHTVFRGDTSDLDIPDYSYKIQDKAFDHIESYIEIMG